MSIAKDQIRQIITENNISSVANIYPLLKDSFKDILQELMEAELDATLGYQKNQKGDLQTNNKRNGHSPKNLKSQYGGFTIDVPRDRNGEFEPKLIPKYQRDISGIEEKVISLYARGMGTRDIHDQLNDLKNRGVKDVLFFCMDDMVPQDHLLRLIDRAINLSFIYDLVEERYCHDNGRPSMDPIMLIKIPFTQYLYGIRSMRQTIREIEVNVAYR